MLVEEIKGKLLTFVFSGLLNDALNLFNSARKCWGLTIQSNLPRGLFRAMTLPSAYVPLLCVLCSHQASRSLNLRLLRQPCKR